MQEIGSSRIIHIDRRGNDIPTLVRILSAFPFFPTIVTIFFVDHTDHILSFI